MEIDEFLHEPTTKAIPKDMPMMPAAPQGVTRGVVGVA